MEKKILLLGNPALYEICEEVKKEETALISQMKEDLRDTLLAFRKEYGVGRAIAAPQIGISKRIIYRHLDSPVFFINPRLSFPDAEIMEVMDDCMSFPGLLVKVHRYRTCVIDYKDEDWNDCQMQFEGDMAELIQHEYDHLDGILATMRALDNRSYIMKE